MIATVRNMQRVKDAPRLAPRRVVVLDSVTGDTFSATPGDYWSLDPDDPILDADGEPCLLAVVIPERFEPLKDGDFL